MICIDPGTTSGIAWFEGGVLQDVALFPYCLDTVLQWNLRKVSRVVVELPRVYPVLRWKGDPNDLISVAYTAGRLVEYLLPRCSQVILIETISPSTWKGQRPKKIDNEHTLSLLSPEELAVIEKLKCPAGQKNHVLDAIGMGLWRLGR